MRPAMARLNEEFPPGTSRLILDRTEIVLVPEPSADPNDPLNWSMFRKVLNVAFMYTATVMIFTSLSMQSVFWPQMSPDLSVTFDQLNVSLACNAAGLCVGCLLFIPFARKYGRRTPYIVSTAVMAACAWWSSRMETLTEVYLTNVLFGLAGSMNETLSEMTVADLFFVHQRGRANAWYIVAVTLGATIIPTIAGVQAQNQGWRWCYYTLGIFLTFMTVLLFFTFEETKYVPASSVTMGQSSPATPVDEENGGKSKVSKSTELNLTTSNAMMPDDDNKAELASSDASATIPPLNSYRQRLRFVTPSSEPLWKNFILPLRTAFLPHVLYTSLQASYLLLFLVLLSSVSPTVFSAPPYNFGTAGVGLMLVGPFIGNALGSMYAGLLGDWIGIFKAKRNGGLFEPEFRLYLLVLPSFLMGGGMILYGASIDRGWHWIYPSIGGGMYTFAMGAIIDMSFTLIIDSYTEATAESFVFITFVRNIGTVGLPFGITPWMNYMSLTNMFIIVGCLCTTLGLLCVPMIIYGKDLRTWSKPRYEQLLLKIHEP